MDGIMPHQNSLLFSLPLVSVGTLAVLALVVGWAANGQEKPAAPMAQAAAADEATFQERVQPLLQKFCVRCHNADNMESGIRVDHLTATLEDSQLPLWKGILKQVVDGDMPPADEPQLSTDQRQALTEWITQGMTVARSRPVPKNGSVRRLTARTNQWFHRRTTNCTRCCRPKSAAN